MDPITILAALMPFAVDLGKSLIGRFITPESGFKPATIGDWLSMQDMQLKLFVAMNEAGGANPSYPWVEAIVRLQRPFVVAVALSAWVWSYTVGHPSPMVDNFCSAVGFYLFGDRTLFYAKKASPK